jgi:hypothetical protein
MQHQPRFNNNVNEQSTHQHTQGLHPKSPGMGYAGHMSQSEVASEHRGCVSKLSEMAFSKSSLPLLLGTFINLLIMICESICYPRVRMDYHEKCCYQNIDYRYLIIYILFQILLVSKSIGFFWWGAKIIPPPPL